MDDAAPLEADALVVRAPVVGVEALAERPQVHLEDRGSHARHVLLRQHRLLRRVHAADGRAVGVLLVARADALEEGDLLRLLVVRGAHHVAGGRAQTPRAARTAGR